MYYHLFVLAVFVGGLSGCGRASKTEPAAQASKDLPAEIAIVQADARRLQNAIRDGEKAAFIELTHPIIIESMGGPEQAESDLDDALADMQSAGMVIESMTFPADPRFFSSDTTDFVFVPMLTTFTVGGQRIESLSYLLGAKPRQTSKWTYIDGSQIELQNQNVDTWFPDFPAGQTYPDTYKKTLP